MPNPFKSRAQMGWLYHNQDKRPGVYRKLLRNTQAAGVAIARLPWHIRHASLTIQELRAEQRVRKRELYQIKKAKAARTERGQAKARVKDLRARLKAVGSSRGLKGMARMQRLARRKALKVAISGAKARLAKIKAGLL